MSGRGVWSRLKGSLGGGGAEKDRSAARTVLRVEGMTCGHCEAAVRGAVSEVEGVRGVEADSAGGTVAVVHDEDRPTVERLEEAVEKAGYTPRGLAR
jgi:copper chaperone